MKIYRKKDHGSADHGWLKTLFHFSFAEYYNITRMNFGVLRVLNDDLIEPGKGFDMHPHRDMEIISYVIDGHLKHADSMGNKGVIGRGNVQYMSAGRGVFHSEHNGGNETTRLLQLWIIPDKRGYEPDYGDFIFDWEARKNKLLHMVSSSEGSAPVEIHQDVNIYSLELEAGNSLKIDVKKERQLYGVQIEGESTINSNNILERDSFESIEENLEINALENSHFLFVEMKKDES